jgi:dTDP-4-amino-4,6-dideoxygalactose transaminase
MIPFNKPYLSGNELQYIKEAVLAGKISGDGIFTKKCQYLLEKRYDFKKTLLTTSCTAALEMAAILLDIQPGDEIIAPSYTFVSTVNAFVLRGAKIIFVDSCLENPNINIENIENLVGPKTKAILVVHYGGIACDMDKVMALANKYNIVVVEDAAHSIDSFYKEKPLGSIGHLTAFSFHETKNIISGEGGMLVINDEKYIERAEIIREKGTNRSAFFRGEINKYEWVDIGSSYLPSDMLAAFLLAQLENADTIQKRRKQIWQRYYTALGSLDKKGIQLPFIPAYATNNAHLFYLVCTSLNQRDSLIKELASKNINAVFHYQSLHKSLYYKNINPNGPTLPQCERYSDCLIRLPLFYELQDTQVDRISKAVMDFFAKE